MAIRSMTGFTRTEQDFDKIKLLIELRSVNNRYIDVRVNQPSVYNPLRNKIIKFISKNFSRGSFDLNIKREILSDEYLKLKSKDVYVKKIHEFLVQLKNEYEIKQDLVLGDFLKFDLMSFDTSISDAELEDEWEMLESLLSKACQDLEKVRQNEGKELWIDIKERLKKIETEVAFIETNLDSSNQAYNSRILTRLQKVLSLTGQKLKIDPNDPRFQQELGFIAERSDITEEMTRLKVFLKEFQNLSEKKESVGRRMDFLLQEMNREVNTMSSKNTDSAFGMKIVNCKAEIEKIRQQVQNIE